MKIMAETKGSQATAQQKTKEPQQGSKRDQQPSKGIQTTTQQGTQQSGLTRREPLGLINRFADEMGRLFGDFGLGRGLHTPFGGGFAPAGFGEISRAVWSPQIEVFEREGQLIVRADLPGLSKDNVKIHITDDQLIIEGERRQEREENEEGFYRSERIYGSFYRSIPLPEGVSDEDVKASFHDGVLEIKMPVPKREQRHRQIEIGDEANSGQSSARPQKASK
jgi:HSP20 family protein